MIEVEQLEKRYGERWAVRGLTFEVKKGEVVGFLGPNGAGKSTTLRMLTGFLEPTAGSIRIAGLDARSQSLEVRRRIGYMPEAVPLYGDMRVREYLRYRARLKGVPRRDVPAAIERSLELASVVDVGDRIIRQLSKGYRQRVGIADALVADPPLLVLDEPTAGLDPNQIRQVRDLLRELSREKTVLLSTHILPEVEALCGRVVIIDQGKLVASGRPADLRGAGAAVVLEVRADSAELVALVEAVEGVDRVLDVSALNPDASVHRLRVSLSEGSSDSCGEAIAARISAAGMGLREMRREQANLEDVFTRLTTAEVGDSVQDDPVEATEGSDRGAVAKVDGQNGRSEVQP